MNRGEGDDQKNREALSYANDASKSLTEMIHSLLDVSRMEAAQLPLQPTPVELRRLAEEAAKAMEFPAQAKRIHITVQGPDTALVADADLTRRVFINLIGNAVKFTPDAGTISVTVSTSDGQAWAEVHDTGGGIPAEYHERIFEKFASVETGRQGHMHSTGLGLTFCRLAVVAHGGQIGVRSTPGEGSTFWFSLPLVPRSEANRDPEEEGHVSGIHHQRA